MPIERKFPVSKDSLNFYGEYVVTPTGCFERPGMHYHRTRTYIRIAKQIYGDTVTERIRHSCENKKCFNPDHIFVLSPDEDIPPRKGSYATALPSLSEEERKTMVKLAASFIAAKRKRKTIVFKRHN